MRVLLASGLLAFSACAPACIGVERDEPATRDARRTVRVAACQLEAGAGREAGFEAIDRALAEAAAGGAELACFPETCLFGWVNPNAHRLADPVPGPTTERLGELARKHGLMIAVGMAERSEDGLYDSAVLIDRDGELLLTHRKVNILSELMDPPYTPGVDARASVVDTRLGRIGLLVCADTFKDDIVGAVAEDEPDLLVVPYGWAAPLDAWPDHGASLHGWIAHTARRVGAPVVGVDAVGEIAQGPWRGYLFGGQSAVCDREGELQGTLADREPEVRIFDVALD